MPRRIRLFLHLLALALACGMSLAAPAADAAPKSSPGPLLWTAPGGVDALPLNSIACPSTKMCVAVDRGGNVVTSTDPAGGPRAWHVAAVDGGHDLTSVSCPSTSLCVAVDESGNVATSPAPTYGPGTWTVVKVDSSPTQNNSDNAGSVLVRAMSCPSAGLCVAVDAAGNALVSTNPAGGPTAWTITHIDTNTSANCSETGLACQPPLVGVSCPPDTGVCAAIDFSGNLMTTSNPAGGVPWASTATTGGRLGSLWGISCPGTSFCAMTDGTGGHAITLNPLNPGLRFQRSFSDYLYGVWCQSRSLCLASVETRGGISALLGSYNATAARPTWSLSSLGGIDGVACPSSSMCLAADDEGNIAVGVTTRAITSLLNSELLPTRHLPTTGAVARTGRARFVFRSPITAQVSLAWTVPGAGGAPVTLGSATHRFNTPGAAALTLRLTAAGVRAFRAAGRLTVTATATFATSTGSVISVKKRTFFG